MKMDPDLKARKAIGDMSDPAQNEAPRILRLYGLLGDNSSRRKMKLFPLTKSLVCNVFNILKPCVTMCKSAEHRRFYSVRVSPILMAILGVLFTCLFSLVWSSMAFKTSPYKIGLVVKQSNPMMNEQALPVSLKLRQSLADPNNELHFERSLVQSFDVPPSLTRKIPASQRYKLLTKLQRATKVGDPNTVRLFVLHVVGPSAAGRLAAIASALSYARNTNRFLVILWDLSRGGEEFGTSPIKSLPEIERHSILFTYVDSLHLSPNLTSWSELNINYYTNNGTGGYPLDNVAALRTRHIFYRAEKDIEGRYSSFSQGVSAMPLVIRPEPPIERAWYNFVKDWTFPHLEEASVTDLLNRVYGVPSIFLDGITDSGKRKLFRALARSSSKRAFFIHAQYGLGNRLRALGSAMAVAQITGRVLVLIWEPDVHLNCRFSDLFVNDIVVIEKLNMNWPPGDASTKDNAMRTVDFYNFMRFNGKHIHNPLKELVNPRSGRHVYVNTAYVVRSISTPRIVSTHSRYWKIMREQLVPQAEIMFLVHDPSFVNIRGMVGVHIRSRTIENDIKGISEEFYGSSSRTTDHWRRLTGLKTFEAKIIRLSLKYKFFVAADSREVIHELEKKFGSHRIFSIPRDDDCVTRDVKCAKLALADILLLAKVPTLLGSHWSSFTEGAVRLSGRVKVLLAGVHFGRQV